MNYYKACLHQALERIKPNTGSKISGIMHENKGWRTGPYEERSQQIRCVKTVNTDWLLKASTAEKEGSHSVCIFSDIFEYYTLWCKAKEREWNLPRKFENHCRRNLKLFWDLTWECFYTGNVFQATAYQCVCLCVCVSVCRQVTHTHRHTSLSLLPLSPSDHWIKCSSAWKKQG